MGPFGTPENSTQYVLPWKAGHLSITAQACNQQQLVLVGERAQTESAVEQQIG